MIVKSIEYKGSAIYYKIMGNGQPVVLVHGFGEDACIWDDLIAVLSKNNLLVVVDLPGTGMSKESLNCCTIADCAAIIEQINLAELLNEFVLLGHSMGGYIALEYAAQYEQFIKGIGLLHSTATADSPTKKEIRLKNIEFLQNNDAPLFLKQTIPNLFAPDFVINHKVFIEKYISTINYINKAALVSYTESMMHRNDYSSFLCKIGKPILFVIGKHDKAVPLELSLEQCHLPKISYIHILKNAGHMGMMERKDEFNAVVKNYIDEVVI